MTFDRFDNTSWKPAKDGDMARFFANSDSDKPISFFNLIETPSGFEFEMHASGARKPPHRLQRGDKFRGTYFFPVNVQEAAEALQKITAIVGDHPKPIPFIQRHLAGARWEPEKSSKGFGS